MQQPTSLKQHGIGVRGLRGTLLAIAAAALTSIGAGAASAQEYPTRTVQIIVPYPAGGATDVFARHIARRLSEMYGKQVLVENRTGAAGSIGTQFAAQAQPDGYTLVMTAAGQAVRMAFPNAGFDLNRDFVPIALVATVPNIVLAHPGFSAQSFKEFMELAKREPGKLTVGSTGTGGSAHLGLELLQHMSGIRTTHVAYRGGAPGLADVLAGHIPVMIDAMSTAVPLVKSGRVRALAVTSAKRSAALPDVPAIAEAVPGYEAVGWYAMFARAGTPPSIVADLRTKVDRILSERDLLAKMDEMGAIPKPVPSDQVDKFVRDEVSKWSEIVRVANVKLE